MAVAAAVAVVLAGHGNPSGRNVGIAVVSSARVDANKESSLCLNPGNGWKGTG